MYTVLLATNQPRISDSFTDFTQWEALGFAPPRIVDSAEAAIAVLDTDFFQAVAIALPHAQSAKLYDRLHGMNMFFLEPVSDAEALGDVLGRMRSMIDHRESQGKTIPPLREALRESFWQTLMDGLFSSESVLRNRVQVLELPVNVDAPCCLTTLQLGNGDYYLQEVWRYGKARLVMALRKFLQREDRDVFFALSGLTANRLLLLACPLKPVDEETLCQRNREHMASSSKEITEYLELEISCCDVTVIKGLTALLKQGDDRP